MQQALKVGNAQVYIRAYSMNKYILYVKSVASKKMESSNQAQIFWNDHKEMEQTQSIIQWTYISQSDTSHPSSNKTVDAFNKLKWITIQANFTKSTQTT